MRFRTIEARLGELPVDEAVAAEAVSRILGITTVEALFLFTSRVTLDGFLEGFSGDGDDGVPPNSQELKAAFERELEEMVGITAEGGGPGTPTSIRGHSLGSWKAPHRMCATWRSTRTPHASRCGASNGSRPTWRNVRAALEASAHLHIHLSASERGGR